MSLRPRNLVLDLRRKVKYRRPDLVYCCSFRCPQCLGHRRPLGFEGAEADMRFLTSSPTKPNVAPVPRQSFPRAVLGLQRGEDIGHPLR